jgi:hypothetical protein
MELHGPRHGTQLTMTHQSSPSVNNVGISQQDSGVLLEGVGVFWV